MIDSFNQTIPDNITLSRNTTQGGDENETDFSLIEIILADVPFLALGFLGLTIITFYSTFNRSNGRMLLLEISSLSACFASLLNLIGMFYNQDQVAFFNFQNIQEEGLRRFILVMLSVKQVLLAISTGTRLLYFHVSLEKIRKQQIDFTHLTNGIIAKGGSEKRPKSFTQMIQERNRTYCDAVDGRDAQCVWSKMARMSIIFAVFVVFALELTWRIGFLFDLSQATTFKRINIASFSIQLVLYLIFSSCPIHHIIQTSPTFRKNVLRQYGGLIAGISLGVVVVIGSLASFGFSERVVGRLFQGVQLYVLIISQMILDFTPLLHSPSPPVINDSNVKYQYDRQDSFEVLSIPDASTFRVSPPSISTPSPHPIPNGKRVSFLPNTHSHRPFSTAHPRTDPSRLRASVSSRIKTWVLSGHSAYSHPEEGRYLNIPPTQRSSGQSSLGYSASGSEGTHETHQNTFGRNSTLVPRPISKDRDSDKLEPKSMEPARRSSQTIFNTLTRFSQGQGDNIMDLIGIRRTTPSLGARRLILGSEIGDTVGEGLPSSGNHSRESGTSGLEDLPLNFPRPPSRSTTVPTLDKLDFGDMAVDELPLPNRLFVREQQLQMKNKGHARMRSDMTHINVTSFIEGGSSRIDSMSSSANPTHQQYQSITSLIQPSNWMSKHHSSLSATLTLSSEAPTEVYLPVPPSQAHLHVQSPTSSGSSETTPTYSIHDVRDAQISRVLTRSNSQPLLSTYTNTNTSSSIPFRFDNPSVKSRGGRIQRQSQSGLSDPIPESPTLPSSANSLSNLKGQVKMGRAATTGQEWYKRKYGVI